MIVQFVRTFIVQFITIAVTGNSFLKPLNFTDIQDTSISIFLKFITLLQ